MSNNPIKDLAESIKDLGKAVKKICKIIKYLNSCIVLKVPKCLSKCLSICCGIQIIAASLFPIAIWFFDIKNRVSSDGTFKIDMTYLIILGGIILCLFIGAIINLIYIQKINRYIVLTAGYEKAIGEIDQISCHSEAKMKYTATVYQHYCQSLTKK